MSLGQEFAHGQQAIRIRIYVYAYIRYSIAKLYNDSIVVNQYRLYNQSYLHNSYHFPLNGKPSTLKLLGQKKPNPPSASNPNEDEIFLPFISKQEILGKIFAPLFVVSKVRTHNCKKVEKQVRAKQDVAINVVKVTQYHQRLYNHFIIIIVTGLNHFIERKEVVSLSFRGSDSSELGQFTFRDSGEVDMVNEVDEDFFPEIKPITDLKKDYKLLGR